MTYNTAMDNRSKELVTVHSGKRGYLDKLLKARYRNPAVNYGCEYVFEWRKWAAPARSMRWQDESRSEEHTS